MINRLFISVLCICFFTVIQSINANIPGGGTGTGANVTLTDNGSTIVLDNGIIAITVNKTTATITSLNYKSMNLFAGGTNGGYFYWTWNQPNLQGPSGSCTIITNPSTNGGNY